LIRALFPNASVILALRHPCDVILSCYMQNLRSTVLSGAFSHFNRIADLYIALADYWQRIAPQLHMPVMISRYENLVQMPEQSTKQLAEFLGLPWSESWLNSASYAKHKAIIHTPSYAQVLEPLNTRALNRWQHYREFFDPEVMERLKPSVQAMGYQLDDC
jgi:Sulfotransferase family